MRTRRQTTRQLKRRPAAEDGNEKIEKYLVGKENFVDDMDDDDSEEEEISTKEIYLLDGVHYSNYKEFVDAKRKRNQSVLTKLGFGPGGSLLADESSKRRKKTSNAESRGLRSNGKKSKSRAPPIRVSTRKSNRLSSNKAQLVALDMYVNNWHTDNTASVVTQEGDMDKSAKQVDQQTAEETFFKGRINDGSDLLMSDAIDLCEPKWIHDDSVMQANRLLEGLVTADVKKEEFSCVRQGIIADDDATSLLASKVCDLSIDDEGQVAKVTPDRIYAVAAHPNKSKLICCAGDKQGYVGLWDVDGYREDDEDIAGNVATVVPSSGEEEEEANEKNQTVTSATSKKKNHQHNGVSLFRVHSRPICCLEWYNEHNMVTSSYDGSIRLLNCETGTFEEIFATYDDSDTTYLEDLGFGLDLGYRFWTQSVAVDHRFSSGLSNNHPCLFVSTSVGDIFHADLRIPLKQRITFYESVSDKKINTTSLHPNGTTLAAAGNDGIVRLFDLRKFRDNRNSKSQSLAKPFCTQIAGLSVSSSFFSQSGKSLLTTSFSNRLDITENSHLETNVVNPTHSIRHNNQTGRWLTTFQAKWHPNVDLFCSGSMNKPRCVEIFSGKGILLREVTGTSLGSVFSRTCFHPSTEKLVVIGGNSSGRVVAIR